MVEKPFLRVKVKMCSSKEAYGFRIHYVVKTLKYEASIN